MPVSADAPGSVTTMFIPQEGDASLGVSFATVDGVRATIESAEATSIYIEGAAIEIEPVRGVLRRLGVEAVVRLEVELPLGCGFGVSGAATLATALAANEELRLGHDRSKLVEASHQAEVAAGTGLGDVFIQDGGGLVWDLGDGLRRTERNDRIQYATYGKIATSDVLGDGDAIGRVTAAGREVLTELAPAGPLAALFDASWSFAERTGLATDPVARAVAAAQDAGRAATMAMIGETVVATGHNGVLEHETRISPTGATLL